MGLLRGGGEAFPKGTDIGIVGVERSGQTQAEGQEKQGPQKRPHRRGPRQGTEPLNSAASSRKDASIFLLLGLPLPERRAWGGFPLLGKSDRARRCGAEKQKPTLSLHPAAGTRWQALEEVVCLGARSSAARRRGVCTVCTADGSR